MAEPEPESRSLRERVRHAYSEAARAPGGVHEVRIGSRLARRAGYPERWLSSVPSASVEVFAGVSCLACLADVTAGEAVLDLGCGGGLDALLVAAAAATVLGVDFSDEMLSRARSSAEAMDLRNVRFELGDAEAIPAPTASIDVALVNGIFNLNPARSEIFSELARVIRPGGNLYAAELVLRDPRPADAEPADADWFA